MKVLLLGARGFLGSYLMQYVPSSIDLIVSARDSNHIPDKFQFIAIDITKREEVLENIIKIKPDVIINSAAISLPDYAEVHKDLTFAVNVTAVQNIIDACKETGSKLVHLSTDYVFSGEKGNYRESDPREPVNYYGQTKLEAEKLIQNSGQKSGIKYLICRTGALYGIPKKHHRRELFFTYYGCLKSGQRLKVNEQIANLTLVDNLARCIYDLIPFEKSAIIHTAGQKPISRYEFAKFIAEQFNLDKSLIDRVDYIKKIAPRPQNSSLDVSRLYNNYNIRFPEIQENFEFLRSQINNR